MIFYRLSLDFSYVFFVSQLYQYAGFKLTFVFSTYILSWFLYLMSIFLTNSKIDKVSDSFFLMAVLSVFAPLTSLYGLDVREIFPVIATISSYTIVYFISTYWHSYTSNYSFLVDGRLITITVSIVSVLLFVVWIFASGVISNANLNFSKVYEFRESNSKVLNIGILSYLNIWVTKIFNIFAIAFCLHKKKYLLAAIFILLQILFFSVLAVKSVFFYPFLVVGIWFYFKKSNSSIVLPFLLILVIVLVNMSYWVFDDIRPASMLIRRVFFVPAELTFVYFEFFQDNLNVYWSNSILLNFIDYPYDTRLSNVIGNYVGTGTNANNGYISSGFAHAGIFGVLIYSVILGITLRILNTLCNSGIPMWMAIALTVVPFRSLLVNSDLLVTMMTHGLLLTVFLIALLRTKNEIY
jgi:hypothetical protein